MATKSYRNEIETLTPRLRQCARALGEARGDHADDLVQEVLAHALRTERGWMGEDMAAKLFGRLISANRTRVRVEASERRSSTGTPTQAGLGSGRPSFMHEHQGPAPFGTGPGRALDALPLHEREALVVVVLGMLDYAQAAQALGVPVGTLVTRVTQARDRLGRTLWEVPKASATLPGTVGQRPRGTHLRLVKS